MAFYLVPREGDGLTVETAFRAKYFGQGVQHSAKSFGAWCLVTSDEAPVDLAVQPDALVIGAKGAALDVKAVDTFKAAGFPIENFTGTTVDDLVAFVDPLIYFAGAVEGVKVAVRVLELHRAKLTSRPQATDLDAFLAETTAGEIVGKL